MGTNADLRRACGQPALLQYGSGTSLSVKSGINTPARISPCKSPVETGSQHRIDETIGLTAANSVVFQQRLHLLLQNLVVYCLAQRGEIAPVIDPCPFYIDQYVFSGIKPGHDCNALRHMHLRFRPSPGTR